MVLCNKFHGDFHILETELVSWFIKKHMWLDSSSWPDAAIFDRLLRSSLRRFSVHGGMSRGDVLNYNYVLACEEESSPGSIAQLDRRNWSTFCLSSLATSACPEWAVKQNGLCRAGRRRVVSLPFLFSKIA
eukprot:s2721_g4.t1